MDLPIKAALTDSRLTRRKFLLRSGGALAGIGLGLWGIPTMRGVSVARVWANGTPCPVNDLVTSETTGDGTSTSSGPTSATTGDCQTTTSNPDDTSDGTSDDPPIP